jgi:acetylornithine deacetylase/succinyl-diaminopimelate desuccinylase-like protein
MSASEAIERAREIKERISLTPRFAGSAEEGRAREFCREVLERAGFECVEQAFDYSQWPGKWGVPVAAAVQVATILVVCRLTMSQGPLFALIIGGALYAALFSASGDAKRRWIHALPFMRAVSTNLEARRGNPKVWLLAHLDSKSQTVPMLVRIASSVALAATTVAAAILLLLSIANLFDSTAVWPIVAVVALVVGLPSLLCLVRNDSPGAVDNASGAAAVLVAAERLRDVPNLGILITSGEELALAGARIWALGASQSIVALNCDTVDDKGGWRLMYSGRRPLKIAARVKALSDSGGGAVAVTRMIPGILADSMALADRGIEAITLSRGTIATLARIHTRRDNSTALTGSGAGAASSLLADLTRELI